MLGHDFNSWGVETHRGSIPPLRRRVLRRSCTVDEAVRQACIRPGNPGESGWWADMTSAGEEEGGAHAFECCSWARGAQTQLCGERGRCVKSAMAAGVSRAGART